MTPFDTFWARLGTIPTMSMGLFSSDRGVSLDVAREIAQLAYLEGTLDALRSLRVEEKSHLKSQ